MFANQLYCFLIYLRFPHYTLYTGRHCTPYIEGLMGLMTLRAAFIHSPLLRCSLLSLFLLLRAPLLPPLYCTCDSTLSFFFSILEYCRRRHRLFLLYTFFFFCLSFMLRITVYTLFYVYSFFLFIQWFFCFLCFFYMIIMSRKYVMEIIYGSLIWWRDIKRG